MLCEVVGANKTAVVELAATGTEEVCRVSACVALEVGHAPTVIPVGSAERLKVMPAPDVLVIVMLMLTGGLNVTFRDDCCFSDIQIALTPVATLLEDISVSLAGMRVPEPCGGPVTVAVLEL